MADFCCRFQSLASTHSICSSFPSKHYYYPSARAQSFNSRTQSLHLTLISKRSRPTLLASDFDVVSTHEHSDGSLLFRFGDPSEFAKNVEIEESEKKVAAADEAEKETILAEEDIGSREKLLESSELSEFAKNVEIEESEKKVAAAEEAEKETVLAGEDNGSREKLLESSNEVVTVVQIEHNGKVDGGLIEEYEDSSAAVNTILDDITTKVELLEKETVDCVASTSGVNIGHDGNEEEGISEAHNDSSSDMESKITTTLEVLETETTVVITRDSLIHVSENDDFETNNVTKDIAEVLDHRNVESETHNDIIEDSREVLKNIVEASVDELPGLKSATESQDIPMTNFVLSSGVALIPHPSKALTGGEDAYFVAGQRWIGVADGVGPWSLQGTNVGAYAQELVKSCERLVSDCSTGESVKSPLELLNLSMAETNCPGSSTVLIAQCDGQALNVANIGDSGFIILRKGSVYKRSSPMHHAFYFPLRIERDDEPSSLAELYRVDLEEDDVIITATDGVHDNLYDQDISSIVLNSLAADKGLEEIAGLLANKAQEIGKSESARSPFCDDAQAAGFPKYSGGKLDAVAVIVSMVKRQTIPETQ